MKVGDLVKMKEPKSHYSWRRDMSEGVGIVLIASHRTERTMRACTVMWSINKDVVQIPEDWVEVIDEGR